MKWHQLTFAIMSALLLAGCGGDFSPQTRWERYLFSPKPASVAEINSWEYVTQSGLDDPAAAFHFKIDPADFDLLANRLGLEQSPSVRDDKPISPTPWFDPATLGDDREFWYSTASSPVIYVWTTSNHDEVYLSWVGL